MKKLVSFFGALCFAFFCVMGLVVTEAEAGKVTFKFKVRALIDGKSQVYITGNKLRLFHLDFAAPGKHGNQDQPTYINGVAWRPSWPCSGECRSCRCFTTSQYTLPGVSSTARAVSVSIRAIASRSRTLLVQRPSSGNNYTIILEWDDNGPGGSDWYETELTIVYDINRSPTLSNPGDQAVDEDKSLSFTMTASDPDNNALTWSNTSLPSGATFTNSGNSRTFSWTPDFSQAGTYTVTFKVTDNGRPNLSASRTVKIVVKNVNRSPILSNPGAQSVEEGKSLSFKLTASEPDGDTLTWSTQNLPTGATFPSSGNSRTFTWTPGFSQAGTYTVSFVVTDNGSPNLSTTQKVTITVKDVNRPPKITSTPTTTAIENKAFTYKAAATDPDVPDTQTWTKVSGPGSLSSSGELTWTPGDTDAGKTFSFEIQVCDRGNSCDSQTWKVTVKNVNDPPKIVGTPAKDATEDKSYTYGPKVSDPDSGDTHSWKLKKGPTGAKVDPKTGQVTWTPGDADAGKTISFEIEVCDRGNSCDSQAWKVTVKNVNDPPKIVGTPAKDATEDKSYTYGPKVSDPDSGDTHSWKLVKGPTGAKVDPKTGQVTWTPGDADAGKTFDFEMEVCDKANSCVKKTWKVTVKNVNDSPKITSQPPTTAYVGEAITYDANVSDPDTGDTHTWTFRKNPQGAKVDSQTGKVTWTPAKSDAGKQAEFELEVCDNGQPKSCVTQAFKVRVLLRCRVDSDCQNADICVQKICTAPGCASKQTKCSGLQFCKDSKCINNNCPNQTCGQGTYCRPADSQCVKPCAGVTCSTGELCRDGNCIKDPCAVSPCKKDEVCDTSDPKKPTCIKDPCLSGSCRHGRICSQGQCMDNPCTGVSCPDTKQRCVTGQCIGRAPCSVDTDCPGSEVCLQKLCYPPGCYDKNNTCQGNNLCLSATCKPDPCASANCKSDEFCRQTDGSCVKACAGVVCTKADERCMDGVCKPDPCAGKQCATGEICIGGKCEKNRCGASSSCKYGRVCNDNQCRDDPCAKVTCPDPKQVCSKGQCVSPPSCVFDKDCPGREICFKQKCVVSACEKDTDCAQDELCKEGKCVADPCKGKSCPTGQFCRDGQCTPSCAGIFCAKDQQCIDGKCQVDPCSGKQCASGETCANGTCKKDSCEQDSCKGTRTCQVDRCVDASCQGVKCPQGQACKSNQCQGPLPCKFDADCPGTGVCIDGKCQPPGCFETACSTGKICQKGSCADNPCATKQCPTGEVCRPSDGACVKNCPTCPQDQVCQNGACQADPCKGVQCKSEERCEAGKCVPNPCSKKGVTQCKFQRACRQNGCQAEPCKGVKCPAQHTCRAGVCYGPPLKPEPAPEPEPESESTIEPTQPDASQTEITTDEKQAESSTTENATKESGSGGDSNSEGDASAQGGCQCNTGTHSLPVLWLLLFFGGLLSYRRRSEMR